MTGADRAGGNPNPTPLDQYDWVSPPESWAFQTGFDTVTGEVDAIIGFRMGGRWVASAIRPEIVSDMTIELGRWLPDYVAAHDNAQQDTDDADG